MAPEIPNKICSFNVLLLHLQSLSGNYNARVHNFFRKFLLISDNPVR